MMTTSQIITKYGEPGPENQVLMQLPYPMVIAWDKAKTTSRMQCHKLLVPNFTRVFTQILEKYGLDNIRALGIDLFGGSYNFRKMRGGNEWSRHSWGIAIDLDPERNPLKASKKTAQFAKPSYKPMIEIFYANGFIGLGPEKDYDWMHFEARS